MSCPHEGGRSRALRNGRRWERWGPGGGCSLPVQQLLTCSHVLCSSTANTTVFNASALLTPNTNTSLVSLLHLFRYLRAFVCRERERSWENREHFMATQTWQGSVPAVHQDHLRSSGNAHFYLKYILPTPAPLSNTSHSTKSMCRNITQTHTHTYEGEVGVRNGKQGHKSGIVTVS